MYTKGLPTEPQPSALSYTQYKGVSEIKKLGRVSATNRIISGRQRLEDIEASFMAISFRANRSDNQRDARRLKRI